MKQYNNKKVSSFNIMKGFNPICCSEEIAKEELSNISAFIDKYTKDSCILVNPEGIGSEEVERNYEIYGGNINIMCRTEQEGVQLAAVFGALTQMRCDLNDFKDGIAYCDFESE